MGWKESATVGHLSTTPFNRFRSFLGMNSCSSSKSSRITHWIIESLKIPHFHLRFDPLAWRHAYVLRQYKSRERISLHFTSVPWEFSSRSSIVSVAFSTYDTPIYFQKPKRGEVLAVEPRDLILSTGQILAMERAMLNFKATMG